MWHADYFIHCDFCHNSEWMDGSTLKEAKQYARQMGWVTRGNGAMCPNCLKKLDEAKKEIENHETLRSPAPR